MSERFISIQDRIIAAAVDIISESGLSALTAKNVAMRENMTEESLYKFYGNMDELLVDVVEYYAKFDKSIQKTILGRKGSSVDRIVKYIEAYATYYDNYYAISTFMLHYEELLHNIYTRDRITECIQDRKHFLTGLFQDALNAGELDVNLTAVELADTITGIVMVLTLDRRIVYHKETYKTELCRYVEKWMDTISRK